jgi:hypothetical protein
MILKMQIDEIARALASLPPDKVAAVKDFVLYLTTRYGEAASADFNDAWTEEDMRDFASASAHYGETVASWDDSPCPVAPTANNQEQGPCSPPAPS